MSCKGLCLKLKALKPAEGGRYEKGQKRCEVCDGIFMRTKKVNCPCCNYKLRSKPRNSKYKKGVKRI